MSAITLVKFVDRYVAQRDICKDYVTRLRKRAAAITEFAGTSDIGSLLTEETVNAFLASFTEMSPLTVKSYREDLLSLWNGAADLDLAPYPRPRRLRRIKCPQQVIECYSLDEVRAILAAATICKPYQMSTGICRRLYWPAIVRLAWDTGLRRGDCWNFRKSWIQPDGAVRITQKKTGQLVTVRLRPSTIESLDAIPFDRACYWPGAAPNSNRFGYQFKAIARKAGVGRGSFKWLRRASGSYVELAHVGAGSKHLGHACPQIFDKHYNAQLGGHTLPQPPDLDGDL